MSLRQTLNDALDDAWASNNMKLVFQLAVIISLLPLIDDLVNTSQIE